MGMKSYIKIMVDINDFKWYYIYIRDRIPDEGNLEWSILWDRDRDK
jgi:hypothetical protein